jgi:hypothetical protein
VLTSAALLGAVPLLVLVALPRQHGRSIATDFNYNTVVPVGVDFGLRATTKGDRVRLTWRAPAHGSSSTFYRVYAVQTYASPPSPDSPMADGIACTVGRGRECSVAMTVFAPGRRTSSVVRLPLPGEWSLRVAQLANWVDDPSGGDDLMLSKPVRVHVDS